MQNSGPTGTEAGFLGGPFGIRYWDGDGSLKLTGEKKRKE